MLGWPIKKTEIRSREGVLHFQRWRILETRWFNLYLHHICESDGDPHFHDHPWSFCSFVLSGYALEQVTNGHACFTISYLRKAFSFYKRRAEQFHKITIFEPLWTLVITGPRHREWGYLVEDKWIQNEEYRKLKHGASQ